MFWKYLLYHTALWMCPPVCSPESFAVAHQLPAPVPLTPEVQMYAPPGVPFAEPVGCPPQVCAVPVLPNKTYSVRFQFKTGPKVRFQMASEEGAFSSTHAQWQGPTGEKGMHLVSCVSRAVSGELHLDCALDLIDQNHTQKLRASRVITLDKPVEVVFKKDGCEPMCAEVTVFAILPPPMPMASAYPLPSPNYLQHPPTYTPPQQAVMPAPIPVCAPKPLPPTQIVMPLPEPMPMPLPMPRLVSFEPAPVVQACTTVPVPTAGMPCPVCPCSVATPTKTLSLRFVHHQDKGLMECQGVDGCCAACQRRTVECKTAGKLTLSAGKTSLLVKGADWKAFAEQIDIRDDGRVVLRGNVRMMCDKLGVCASVKAEELNVEVKQGKFEKLVTK